MQNFLNRSFAVINLTDGNEKAFHDRYLLLYPHEGPAKVFLLSNSLNKAAGDWPYCMNSLRGMSGAMCGSTSKACAAAKTLPEAKP